MEESKVPSNTGIQPDKAEKLKTIREETLDLSKVSKNLKEKTSEQENLA
jgi:hypothetical protein